MATTKKRKTRKRSTSRPSIRKVMTLSGSPKRRRRKSGLLSSSTAKNIGMTIKHNGAGAIGGVIASATRLVKLNPFMRAGIVFAGAIGASMLKAPFIGAGMSGVAGYMVAEQLIPIGMLADDMEDAEFVNADVLSDTGETDTNGNPIVMDDNGNAYALNEAGELERLNDSEFNLSDDLQNVSMLPLQDAYALSNPYNLSSSY